MADDATNTGTGGAGSTDAGATGQQPNGSQQTTQQPATSQGTQQTTQQTSSQGQTGQTGSTTAFTYKEDRSDWVPRHRLNEVSTKTQELKTQLEDAQRRLTIALGGQPSDPQTQKAEQVREAFFNLPGMGIFRKLANLTEDQLEAIFQVPSQVATTRDAEFRQWQRHGNQQLDVIAQKVSDAIGSDGLDDDQKSDLRENFSSWLRTRTRTELRTAVDRYGEEAVAQDERRFSETVRRYEDGDPKLLDEFVTRYTKNWVEPARRTATARTATRTRPTPDSSGRTALASSVKRPDKFNSLDDRIAYAAELAKERGVQFGR